MRFVEHFFGIPEYRIKREDEQGKEDQIVPGRENNGDDGGGDGNGDHNNDDDHAGGDGDYGEDVLPANEVFHQEASKAIPSCRLGEKSQLISV